MPPRQSAAAAATAAQNRCARSFTFRVYGRNGIGATLKPPERAQQRHGGAVGGVKRMPVLIHDAHIHGAVDLSAHQDDRVSAVGIAETAILDRANLLEAVLSRLAQ